MSTIPEKSFKDAPIEYNNEEAMAWSSGYNDCYQLATDGREELEKELENTKRNVTYWHTQANQVQSSLKEKEKEISGYKKVIELKNDEITEYSRNLRNAVDQNGKNLHGAYLELQAKDIELKELKAEILELRDSKLKDVKEINSLEAENERLSGLLVSLSNGEAMNVVRESEGVYSVIFKTPKA